MITISDDCSMKLWRTASTGTIGEVVSDNDLKADYQITTETTTCICQTGQHNDLIVSGCHSGNINISKLTSLNDLKTIVLAHQNLIRVVISLTSLNNLFFVSADICGTIKVWPSNIVPKQEKQSELSARQVQSKNMGNVIEIGLKDAISYNSMIELKNVYLKDDRKDVALIACAMKSKHIYIILLMPDKACDLD